MPHNDLHEDLLNRTYNRGTYAASEKTYKENEKGPAKPTTANESQEPADAERYCTWKQGTLTLSEIYEAVTPDGETQRLCIDGPGDGFISLRGDNQLIIRTGQEDKIYGAGGGKLCIYTGGQMQRHEGFSQLNFNKGEQPDGVALNIMAEGDIVCDAEGSETHIKANKIRVYAREVLELIGDEMVRIQAGKEGGGPVMIYGGSVTTVTDNLEEIISGQRMTFGVSEDTTVSFDPRANASIVSAGHINRYIAGDYLHTVVGVSQYTYGGGVLSVPFVKDRTNALSITTLALPIKIDAKTILTLKGGGAIDIDAGAAITANAVGGIYLDAQGEFSAKAKAKTTISGISGSLEFSGIDFILKNLAGATVKSVGPVIHLN